MLKLIAKQEGCFTGFLRSVLAGGTLGVIFGYFVAGFFFESSTKRELFFLIRWGFSTAGFLFGVFVWGLGEAIYFFFFMKTQEEDKI